MSNSHPHWERGGLYTETGPLERLLPVGELMVPNDVELEGEWLCWGWRGDPVGCRKSANRNPIAENRLQPMPSSLAGCLMHCTSSSLLPPVG